MTTDVNELKIPSKRLKYIRERLLKLSRADVYKKHGLSPDTLAAWENGKIQISKKGLERCIKIYGLESLIVSREWLLTGEGLSPKFSFELSRYFRELSTEKPNKAIDDNILLVKEIEFFRSLSSNSVTALVANEDMLPVYTRGDYVGGRFRYGKDIQDCVGKDCIIKTKDGATYIRRLSKNTDGFGYNLVCLNPRWQGSQEPIIFNVEINCAAPIIWHRRLDGKG